jgi:ABC-type glycerol-3-phosphate transport system substrate-binding protein
MIPIKAITLMPFLTMVLSLAFHAPQPMIHEEDPLMVDPSESTPSNYDEVLASWVAQGSLTDHPFQMTLTSDHIVDVAGISLTTNTRDYDLYATHNNQEVVVVKGDAFISYEIESPSDVLVSISMDYYPLDTGIRDLELAMLVNHTFPYFEAQQITLNKAWVTPPIFAVDRYQNDIMPKATLANTWLRQSVYDAQRLQTDALLIRLESGTNTLTLFGLQGEFLLGHVRLAALEQPISYADYRQLYHDAPVMEETLLTYQAEQLSSRNSLLTRFTTNREPRVVPFALVESRLNVIDGSTYQTSGQAISYSLEVPATGFYRLTFKVLQNRIETISYRRLRINGVIPFMEANTLPFAYSRSWKLRPLGPLEGDPYEFFLTAGSHTLTLEVNATQTRSSYQTIQSLMQDVNALSLAIKKITGNTIDPNREWDLITYLPSIETDLDQMIDKITEVKSTWMLLNNATSQSDVLASLTIAERLLVTLRSNINAIPRRLNTLSGTSGSVLYRLGIILPLLIQSPLTIDAFYLHGNTAKLPKVQAGFFETIWVGIQRFFASFFSDQFKESTNPEELVVWVSRSRQYVNLLQQMVDASFTQETGIPVRISINPNEDKLILASSANRQPDIAMGVAGWRPYDFAIRNNVYDLSSFTDFRTISDRFYPGSFLQLIYQDGVYGLPETQNFYLLFYRRDIMNRLNLDVPDTWDDVISILPELQRFGLNFYSMLSSSNAFKAFVLTMPFIRQFGGKIFSEDGLSAAYDDPNTYAALTLMTDLFTTYSLPLEVGSFYNEFRYGRLPIGIGDFGMYISLLHAAPEIAGLWDVAPLPGVEHDGEVNRSFDGSSTSAMIFKNTKKPQEAWTFLKWWTSASIQLDYAENLISAYGPEYLWNTSNREAFSQMSWDENHRQTMLQQWEWINDTAKTPASYMVERELSNIWNRVVFQGANLRSAIEDSLIIANKEIRRKMIEFRFIDAEGTILKPYILPTKETIGTWIGTQA